MFTFPPASHQISACDRLTTLLLKATLLEHTSPPPPAIVNVAESGPVEPPEGVAPELTPVPPAALPPAVGGIGRAAGVCFSVNRPILSISAGGRPLTVGPTSVTEAAATDGVVPGGTTIGITSRMTGSNARDREVSRCGTSLMR